MVSPDYFDKNQDNYWCHSDWVNGWKKVTRSTYDPLVNIKAIRKGRESSVIPELLKYGLKPSSYEEITAYQLDKLTNQLHNVHAVNRGGVLRDHCRDIGNDDIDLIGNKNDDFIPTGWQCNYEYIDGQYIYNISFDNKQGKAFDLGWELYN